MDPDVRPALGQRGLLRRREEAARDRPARAARPRGRDPRRDRLRASTSTRSRSSPRASTGSPRKGDKGVLLITHYTRILRYITPDFVHVFVDGRIAEEGGPELADAARGRGLRQVRAAPTRLTDGRPVEARRHRPSTDAPETASARTDGPLPDVERPQGLPDPRAHARRTASRWSTSTAPTPRRSRRWSSTRWSTTSSGTTPTSPGRCTSSARSRPAAFEGGPRQGRRASSNAPSRDEVDLHQERLRGAQPGGQHAGVGRAARGRRGRRGGDHRDGAPLQHRAVAAAHRAQGRRRCAGSGSPTTAGSTSSQHRRADQRAHQGRLADLGLQHARHGQPGRRDRRAGPTRSAPSSSSTPRRPRRSCRSTCRPLGADFARLHRPQGHRPDRHRRALGPPELLGQLPPFLGGGEMIETVTMERSTYAGIPHKFEAGTPPIVEAVGLGAAAGLPQRDRAWTTSPPTSRRSPRYALDGPGRPCPGSPSSARATPTQRGGAVSFEVDGVPPARRRQLLDSRGIAVRAGHHCAKPAARAVRRAELDPGLVVPLHDAGRDRRARRGVCTTPRTTSRSGERDRGPRQRCTRRSSWTTTATAPQRAAGARTRPRCTT